MKKYFFTFFFGVLIGSLLNNFMQEPVEPVIKTNVQTQTKILRIKEPSGKIIEQKIIKSKIDSKPVIFEKPRYSVSVGGLNGIEFVQVDARLGNLPVFAGVNAGTDNIKFILRYEF